MENEILYNAYINWRSGLEKFHWLLVSTPFASIDDINEFSLIENITYKRESRDIFKKYESIFKNLSEDRLVLIDLEGEEALDLALMLNSKFNISPVLVFAQIYHKNGIVGNKFVLSKLIEYSFRLSKKNENKYSFICDYSRYGNEGLDKSKFFNNQYELTDEELPLKEDFLGNGIHSVILLTYDKIKEDMESYIEYLKECNINVEILYA